MIKKCTLRYSSHGILHCAARCPTNEVMTAIYPAPRRRRFKMGWILLLEHLQGVNSNGKSVTAVFFGSGSWGYIRAGVTCSI